MQSLRADALIVLVPRHNPHFSRHLLDGEILCGEGGDVRFLVLAFLQREFDIERGQKPSEFLDRQLLCSLDDHALPLRDVGHDDIRLPLFEVGNPVAARLVAGHDDYFLDAAQELLDDIKPTHTAGHVIESIDALYDDPFTLYDRDLLGA